MILEVVKKKRHFVFFDSAYQGFANDDLNDDTFSLKLFAKSYLRVMLAQSFSKNFGLYGERTGTLSMICTDNAEQIKMQTRLKDTCLPYYSNPPIHGARIVDLILGDEELTNMWKAEVLMMSKRLRDQRALIVHKLKELGSTHDWSHITNQIGMFAFTGLTAEMVAELREKHSIYMPPDGRISVAGINSHNIDHVCSAFHAVSAGKEI